MKKRILIPLLFCTFTLAHAQSLPSIWVIPSWQDTTYADVTGNGYICLSNSVSCKSGYEIIIPDVRLRKGCYVELDLSFMADTRNAPRYYVLQQWQQHSFLNLDTFKVTMERPVDGEFATSLHTLCIPATGKTLSLRLMPLESAENAVRFAHQNNMCAYISMLGTTQPKDTLRVLCIGNSFTYVYETPYMLKQLAWSQGHYIDMHATLRGGFNFGNHLNMQGTDEAIREGHYDYVFLQNQSQTNAWYAQDSVAHRQTLLDAEELVRRIRIYSPNAKIVIESTWSYPAGNWGGFGSAETYDFLMEEGSRWIAERVGGEVSYINRAFTRARQLYPDLAIYGDDAKHQSAYGSYLKACVNYRVLYGQSLPVRPRRLWGNKANPDLWFSSQVARKLRIAADLSSK